MKTRQGVARRLALFWVIGAAGLPGQMAASAYGIRQDSGQPTGRIENPASATNAQAASVPAPPPTPSLTAQELAPSFGGEKAFTRPWRDSVMGFSQSSRVLEVLVAGGQDIRKGQLLIRGEDEEESARLELQRMRADSTLQMDKARKSLELATLFYTRYREAESRGGTNKQELDRARLDFEASEIDVGLAQLNQDQEQVAIRLAQARLDRIRIVAPFDGTIDVINVDVGHSVTENDKVIRVVDTSRLWIDVGVPTGQTIEQGLTTGGKAWALMSLPGEPRVYEGRIVEVSPVADPGSNTRRIRVEIENPSRLVAGVTA
ncbi:MAG TPA: efflux RND transporter periplasmic adaptor subunit, partial [Phycisphaerales bacterium]|nr:efflux RND transporter periplasmic adaptor subunit [Phycisphaerales bacterium]